MMPNDGGASDEERGHGAVPERESVARSSSWLILSFGDMNILSIVALSLAIVSAVGAGYQFSPAPSSRSPDGKWELMCKAPANGEADARHVLVLKRIRGGVFEIRRIEGNSCFALWSPDSSRIA